MIDEYIRFLILYLMAHIISISTIYVHFHYLSILLNKGKGIKNVILLLILLITYVILCLLIPGEMIYIGFRLVNADKWEGGWGHFLIVISWLIPSLIIAIKKNKEIEIEMKKKEETERNR